jgi:hypothetical protein
MRILTNDIGSQTPAVQFHGCWPGLPLALLPPCCWLLPPAAISAALLAGDSAALCLLSTAEPNSFAGAVQMSSASPVDPAYREREPAARQPDRLIEIE